MLLRTLLLCKGIDYLQNNYYFLVRIDDYWFKLFKLFYNFQMKLNWYSKAS